MEKRAESPQRGQSGIEFLAVTAIGLMMLVGISLFILSGSSAERDETALQQGHQILSTLASQAETVWAMDKNSWLTPEVTLPENTKALYTVEGDTLVIEIGTSYGGTIAQPYFMRVPISGGYTSDGTRTSAFRDGEERGGPVRIRVLNNGTSVVFLVE